MAVHRTRVGTRRHIERTDEVPSSGLPRGPNTVVVSIQHRTARGRSEDPSALDEDCLRRLAGELEAVARHELPWHDANERDLGAILADLLASLADALADHQALVSSEAYLRTQADPGLLQLAVTIDGSLWRRVAGLESAGPSDPVYVAERGAEGSLTLRFGDGQHGRRPPPRRARHRHLSRGRRWHGRRFNRCVPHTGSSPARAPDIALPDRR